MENVTTRTYSMVWLWLIVLTGIEVFLGYIHVPLAMLLVSVIGLSIVKAVLILAYFMHLKFERLSLILTIVPAMVICILLFLVFFPDGFRAFDLKSFR
ncbi:MAG TPA: cytochrome C oxidase subunit IV family protein [Blastocatellia bacterium]|nr:cytochrome C oxidase subunit IV family protein [Blastocatellia bacterium]